MAKKKIPPVERLLKTPLSIKNMSVFAIFALSIVAYNFYSLQSPLATIHDPPAKSVTQSDLMNVLGETISLGEKTEESQQELKKDPEAFYWLGVIEEKPNYRDAYLILATLAFNKHLCTLSQSYLNSALTLDPLSPVSQETKDQILSCGK